MAAYRLNLLGGFDLRTGAGDMVRLPTRKAEALLAYLALTPRGGHARDALTGLLWGESSDRSARASLRQTLFLIGKSFDRGTLVTEGRTVALAPGALDVDVAEFERCSATDDIEALDRAAGLYRGELLSGLALNEPAFEEWLLGERERLRERAIEALARLVPAFGERRSDQAIQAALRLTALDPLEESAHRALMRLYANAGRRAAALRQYQSCVGILQRDLAAEPAPETQALYRDILQRPTHTSRSPSAPPVASLIPAVTANGTPSPIGRAQELLQLHETLESGRQGRGAVVLIVGEAGIGKTTVLTSVAAEAASLGAYVLLGRSYESDQILPFAPWVDAVQMGGVLSGQSIDELDPIWRAELTRLFPELQRPDLPVPSGDQRRLFESAMRLVERLAAAAPLVILLEDLHWADEMSTRLLAFLARRIRDKRVLLIGTAREEDLADALPLRRALEELRLEPHFTRVPLSPLSAVDTAILVQSLRPSGTDPVAEARLADRIWKISEGNPFVAVETLRALAEGHLAAGTAGPLSLPDCVREVIGNRLERLTIRGRDIAATAAVIGREFDFRLVGRAAMMADHDAAEAVEELVRRRVLHASGDGFDFSHDHIRQAAYAKIFPPRRKLLHAQIARALEALYERDLEPHYAALGLHYEQGEVWDKALVYLQQAGIQAARRSAYREAARSFERSIAILPHQPEVREGAVGSVAADHARQHTGIELRLLLRNALLPLGDEARIFECLREAKEIADQVQDSRERPRILAYLCRHAWRIGDYSSAAEYGRTALALASAGDHEGRVAANLYLGFLHHSLGNFDTAIEYLQSSLTLVDQHGTHERFGLPYLPAVLGRAWLAWCLGELGEFGAALLRTHEAIEIAEALDQPWERLVAYWAAGVVHIGRGDHSDAVNFLDRALRLCESSDVPGWFATLTGYLGYARALSGELTDGVRLLQQAVAISDATRFVHESSLLAFLSEALAMIGRPQDALERAKQALRLADERGERAHRAYALRALAQALAQARPAEAKARHQEALGLGAQLGMRPLMDRIRKDTTRTTAPARGATQRK